MEPAATGPSASSDECVDPRPVELALPHRSEAYSQDSEWCVVQVDGVWQRIRFHDYGRIYDVPSLYERLFYDVLECRSPAFVGELLRETLLDHGFEPALRVLDLGAGNGIMGEEMVKSGAQLVVGVDILEQAKAAAVRDRPDVYADYLAIDMFHLGQDHARHLKTYQFDCLTCVAALGFGDIPPECFRNAYNLVEDGGWVAFTIKDDFLTDRDTSGFAHMIRGAIREGRLQRHRMERYQHRRATTGEPLYYTAIIGSKVSDLP